MSVTSLEPKLPIPPLLVAPLLDLDDLLRRHGIPYLLTGGMAREILLHYGYGCPRGRETTDLDFGVTLPNWNAYELLKAALVASNRFRADPVNTQRVIHTGRATKQETNVDLVPFGAIASADGQLAWPPDGSHVMSVLGYNEALEGAIRLEVDANRTVPIASPSGLVLLKLVAWADRGEERLGRDAVDFVEILRRAHHFLTDPELYDDHPEAMRVFGFEPQPAGAWVIGRHVAESASVRLSSLVLDVLQPGARERLLDFASRGRSPLGRDGASDDEGRLVEAFEMGFRSTDRLSGV